MAAGALAGMIMLEGFVITTLDSAIRLTRYLVEEIWHIAFGKYDIFAAPVTVPADQTYEQGEDGPVGSGGSPSGDGDDESGARAGAGGSGGKGTAGGQDGGPAVSGSDAVPTDYAAPACGSVRNRTPEAVQFAGTARPCNPACVRRRTDTTVRCRYNDTATWLFTHCFNLFKEFRL